MKLGWSFPKRQEFLRALGSGRSLYQHQLRFQRTLRTFGVHKVPIDLPRYRLENGRTYDRQAEYLAEHPEKPDNFFVVDLESAEAQEVQHQILVKLASGSKNLFEEFRKGEQSEPIILSAQGFVVNGNRRLSTWRKLYENDQAEYARYEYIDVIILPHCEEWDLDQLEDQLQLRSDLKADYSWTSQALMYREKMRRYSCTEKQLAEDRDLKLEGPDGLEELLDAIEYAEEYLESRSKARHYSHLDGKQFAFRQMVRTRKKMGGDEPEKEVFQKASFCLADDAAEGQRTYTEIIDVGKNIVAVIDGLVDELDLGVGEDLEERCEAVADALDDPENFETAREAIREILASEGEKRREKKKKNFVASQIGKARAALEAAKDAQDDKSSTPGVVEDLEHIRRLADEIMEWARVTAEGRC